MRRPDVFTLDYSHPLAQGLVFAGLGNGRGTSVFDDASIERGHGVINGATPIYSDSVNRHAIDFDGSNDWLNIPRSSKIQYGQAWTLSMFARRKTGSSLQSLFSLGNGSQVIGLGYWRDSNLIRYNSKTGTYTAKELTGFTQTNWNHFSFVCTGTAADEIAYLNSVAVELSGTSTLIAYSPNALEISRGYGGGYYSPMQSADIILHNRALSPAEIALLADRTDPMLGGLVREVNPVAYFDFGGTSSTVDNLTATDLVTGSPALGTPALGQVHALTATGITTSAPALGTPALGQVHGLAATALTVSAPVLGTPAVGQIHSLTASALVVGSPVLGTPSLTENAPDVDALTAVDLVVGSPALGTPAFGQIHVLGSDGLVTGSPVLGSPSITQIHTLEALGLTVGVPVIGTPALNGSDIVIITAAEVARIVRATSRMKTVTASARVKQVRYEVTRA